MSTEPRSLATLSALIRTAEWSVDSARVLHQSVTVEQTTSATKYESAQTVAEQAQQFTREFLARTSFGADMLVMAAMNQALLDEKAEQTLHSLREVNARLEAAHQQLLSERITQQLYERLRKRKAESYDQETHRRTQREQDDAGCMLKVHEISGSTRLTDKGITYGY